MWEAGWGKGRGVLVMWERNMAMVELMELEKGASWVKRGLVR